MCPHFSVAFSTLGSGQPTARSRRGKLCKRDVGRLPQCATGVRFCVLLRVSVQLLLVSSQAVLRIRNYISRIRLRLRKNRKSGQ